MSQLAVRSVSLVLFLATALGFGACTAEPPFRYLGEATPNSDTEEPGNVVAKLTTLPDGSIVSIRNDGAVYLWNIGGEKQELAGPSQAIGDFAAAASSGWLLIAREGRVMRRRLPGTEESLVTQGKYATGAISADGETMALVTPTRRRIEIWHAGVAERGRAFLPKQFDVNDVVLSADGTFLAVSEDSYSPSSGHSTQIEVRNTKTGERNFISDADDTRHYGVWGIAISEDGKVVAVDTQHNDQGGLTLWEVVTGNVVMRVEKLNTYWLRGLSMTPDARYVAGGGEDGQLRTWRVSDQTELEHFDAGQIVNAVSLAADGKNIAAALWDSTIALATTRIRKQP